MKKKSYCTGPNVQSIIKIVSLLMKKKFFPFFADKYPGACNGSSKSRPNYQWPKIIVFDGVNKVSRRLDPLPRIKVRTVCN